jgi:hypothetical protein
VELLNDFNRQQSSDNKYHTTFMVFSGKGGSEIPTGKSTFGFNWSSVS